MTARNEPVQNSAGRARRKWIRRLIVCVAITGVLFGAATARLFVWPPLAELPDHADAIIELAGPADLGRDSQALQLARDGRAPVLVQSTVVEEAGTSRCLPPVPEVTILCFHPDPGTTRGEAEWIGSMAAERHWNSVILVTTPDQAMRAQLRLSRCFSGEIYVSTTPLPLSDWPVQIAYQWGASFKALFLERSC